ncbi:neural proliferation differentiation and control protein 1 isoform X2 [Pyxicephalus adspersus]|uniref:neural proliferation differentiation and control protein 1 isoform X2 n=1 Tax=Pyxicephalus adspersus TaxID=30357 RepID=UPI003B5C1ABD
MGGTRRSEIPSGIVLCCCVVLFRLGAGSPASQICRSIDCPLQKREVCPQGSSECGPCIHGYKESINGKCVEAKQVNSTPSHPPPPLSPPAEAPSGRSPKTTSRPPGDALLLGVVVACALAGLMALMVAGICWCRMRQEMKMAEKTDYPACSQSPPPPYENTSPGDKKLAQNAQMYHYQHQKQQMISMEKNKDELKHPDSAVTSDEENEDGDFTVYECPGLAPTGEMEVKNPLFDDSTLHHSSHHPH